MTGETKNTNNPILVIYVGVLDPRTNQVFNNFEEMMNTIINKITPKFFQGEIICIPTLSFDTKLECINPIYITDEELIKKHHELLEKLNNNLVYQINEIKKENEKKE